MNGLKYIRNRCNLSLNELADAIGVTRQALCSWENGRKQIPERRKEQLEDFFGIKRTLFGEITEADKEYILGKAMFRYRENEKDTYRYKPIEGSSDADDNMMWFLEESPMTLDEKYNLALKEKQETMATIDEMIRWEENPICLHSTTMCIKRGCEIQF